MNKLGIKGDTIVEVLMATLVVSTVMTGAFVSTQRSLTGTRMSQERVEALKVGEEQIERLKAIVIKQPTSVFSAGAATIFCLDNSGALQPVSQLRNVNNEDFTNTGYHPPSCARAPANTTTYYPVIQRNPSAGNTFKAYVRWDSANGKFAKEELTIAYRLYR